MRQLAEIQPVSAPAPDLEPVSALEALNFTGRAIGAHEAQLAKQYGAQAVSGALKSIQAQVNGLGDKTRPYHEQSTASTVQFALSDRELVLRSLDLVDEDGRANSSSDEDSSEFERQRERRANRKLANMVLRQFTEGDMGNSNADAPTTPFRVIKSDTQASGANAPRVVRPAARPAGGPGRHRRPVGASRPAGRPTANHAPRHARAGAFSASRVLSGISTRRGLGLRRRVRS